MSLELISSAVNPDTGELLEHLDQQPPEALAEALDAIYAWQAKLKRSEDAIAAVLRQCLKVRQARTVVWGDWSVEASVRRESVWDGAELEPVLQQLVDDRVVAAGDLTGIIVREPVVSRSKANALAKRLDGDAKAAVEACCTWKEKSGKLTVVRSVQLPAPDPEPALTPSPPDRPPGGDGRPLPTPDLDPESLFR
jgi:hypothetical protein